MRIYIKSTSIAARAEKLGSVQFAVSAGETCIASTGIPKNEIDLLIFVGTMRNKNIIEPSLASIIQKKMQINDSKYDFFKGRKTFSFDLLNGPVGFLNACQCIEALCVTGAVKNALIVSSDCHPSEKKINAYPFSPIGSAAVINFSTEIDSGFQEYHFFSGRDEGMGYEINADFNKSGLNTRNEINILFQDGYLQRLINTVPDLIDKKYNRYISGATNLNVILSIPFKGFGEILTKELGIPSGSIIDAGCRFGNIHTSSLMAGYHLARTENLLPDEGYVLFVGIGAGLSVGLALYKL